MTRLAFVLALGFGIACSLSAQSHQLVKKWETEAVLKTPESVIFDAENRVLYASNMGADAWVKNGQGSIAKIGLDGKIIALDWVSGFNAPKGLGLFKGKLYAAVIEGVLVIDLAKGAVAELIPIEGGQQLNDITVDRAGVVYVSDSKAGKVYAVNGHAVSVFVDKLKGPNGLLAQGDEFYVLDQPALFRVEKDKTLTQIIDGLTGGPDGIEHIGGNDFIVSCWRGAIHYVDAAKRERELLLETGPQVRSTDIGIDPKTRTLYVPTFTNKTIVAYEVK